MRASRLIAFVALAGVLGSAAGVGGPPAAAPPLSQVPTFGSTVSATRIKVAVLDRAGLPVADLGAADFRVFDDGEERAIDVVLAPDATPLELALVPDFSPSVGQDWPDARERVAAFLDALAPADCAFLLPFNSRLGPGVRAPADHPLHRLLISRFPMSGRTRLYDALLAAAAGLGQAAPTAGDEQPLLLSGADLCARNDAVERRQAIVLLTDGADAGSGYSYRDVLYRAWRGEIPIFPVAVGTAALSRSDLEGYRSIGFDRAAIEEVLTVQGQLEELARVSGGRLVSQREIRDGYAEVLALLRGYYVLAYRTPQPRRSGWHEVEVRLRDADAGRVIVQPGYFSAAVDPTGALAALEEGWELLRTQRPLEAIGRFRAAAAAGVDEIGLPDLGAGRAFEALGQASRARAAYLAELERHPGLGAVHARLARLAQWAGEIDVAWEHALRARAGGEDVGSILAQLRARGDQPADLDARSRRPVLFLVRPSEPSLEGQLRLGPLLRGLGRAIEALDEVVLTAAGGAATHYVRLEADRLDADEIRGHLELWAVRDGDRLERESFRVRPSDDLAAVMQDLADPLEALLRDLRRDRR